MNRQELEERLMDVERKAGGRYGISLVEQVEHLNRLVYQLADLAGFEAGPGGCFRKKEENNNDNRS
jgi:hypothetical protein